MVELSAGASVAIGVIVGLLSTSIQSIGLTLQRKSHLIEDRKHEDEPRRAPYRRRRWQLGMLMFVVANIVGSTIQITTLPLPVLSTLQASGLVFNSICASIILSEPFTRYSLVGTILVAIGAVLIGIFGAMTEPSHNLDQLLELLGRTQFLLWLMGTFLIVLTLMVTTWVTKHFYPRPSPRTRLALGMLFGSMSGILSAHSLLVAKSAVELIVRTIVDSHNQFNRWQSWMILLGLIVLALSQLYYLHCGLKLCSTSVLYPYVFCVYNIVAILDGLIYFHQTSRLSALHGGLIALGTVILLSGVLALSWRLEDAEEGSHDQPKTKKRVPTAQTALTPGMGILDPAGDNEDDFDVNEVVHNRLERPTDEESGQAGERTPLLSRQATLPNFAPTSKKRSQIKPRGRRMTISEETNEIWDELNDRRTSLPSPLRRNTPVDLRRANTGNFLAGARRDSNDESQKHWWWEPRNRASLARVQQTEDGEETDASSTPDLPPEAVGRRLRSGSRAKGEQGRSADWFRLKWWKKRWRDGNEGRTMNEMDPD
ncbi:hypothetical protein M501DRAFT_932946 [Patellaria atrata CBS 101060]|uniref:DUF803 domain-containing protein n=1 Tax=Patellaria atrata CBS 101060 TaxID=1346257 RepID=A0A9P4VRW1_9PEZI|nr:hypothetical protein M501DRAFT_932946 [Patellaria atrata CBS 101060]